MGDHLVLYVDRLITPSSFEIPNENVKLSSPPGSVKDGLMSPQDENDEGAPLIPGGSSSHTEYEIFGGTSEGGVLGVKLNAECRICQEEDEEKNMEAPCACSGSLKFAHRKCVQRWCNEKCSTICEICHEPYTPGYTAPPQPLHSDDSPIDDISGNWGVPGVQLDPRLLAMAAAERHFLEAEYDEYATANASGAAFCRSAALILMALLLLRHALNMTNAEGEEDSSTFFSIFLLRAAGFLLPCYIMAWAISILQRRRQRQEAAMAAAEVALLLEAGQARGLQYAPPGSSSGSQLA
ncbi:uncharacterized protein LOC131029975 [Cryptomeria japonica]|uniref:uncharacterized protein LOC131029975 n=1 Tax=Cryptomeria japonica TaxID=3369 RepID=UPI0025ACDF04|nr:uncharacterized protein LOC131029975 [Cryptomeria japonica]